MNPTPECYVVELAEVADPLFPPRPVAVRLRHALKTLLRRDGLRCVRIADGAKVDVVTKLELPTPTPES
jgi:hypothetical protein